MLQKLLLAIDDCAWAYNLNLNKYVFISPTIHSILGVRGEALMDDKDLWYKIAVAEDQEMILDGTTNLKTDEWTAFNYRIKIDGLVKWIFEKKTLFTDAETGDEVLLGIVKEAPDRREIDKHLNTSLGDFSILFEKNPNPMWIYEIPSLRILKVNEAAIDLYGYTNNEFLGFTIRDIRPKIDLAKFNRYIFNKGITKGVVPGYNNSGTWRHVNKNGDIIYAEITGHEIKYNDTECRIVVATNVTERVRYEDEVKKRESLLTSLIESQTNFLIRLDAHGYFTYANTAFLKAFGFQPDEVIEKHFGFTAIKDDEHLCHAALKNCLQHPGKVMKILYRNKQRSGFERWSEWEIIGLADDDGNITDIQAVGQDVTERVNIQTSIKQAAQKLDSVIESITDGFCVINHNYELIRVNNAFETTFGLNRSQVLGRRVDVIFPETNGSGFETAYKKALDRQMTLQVVEFSHRLNLWSEITLYPSVEGMTVFLKNITKQKQVREEILLNKNNLEALINNTDDLIWSVNHHYSIISLNKAFQRFVDDTTGFKIKAGDSLLDAGYPKEIEAEWINYYQKALTGENYTAERDIFNATQQKQFTYELSFNPIYNKKNQVVGVGCFARNITDRLQAENSIYEQNKNLRRIASLSSHELRGPVATLLGLTSLFDIKNPQNPANLEIMNHCKTVTERLDDVIREIVLQTFISDMEP